MKRTSLISGVVAGISLVAVGAALVAFPRPAASAPQAHSGMPMAMLVIRHQTKGCHSWSYDGGPYRAVQSVKLQPGQTLRVMNDDVMPHTLVELAGPKVAILHPTMGHMQAMSAVRFNKPGVYRFRTHGGEDYFKGVKTTGPDNVLRLTVTVR